MELAPNHLSSIWRVIANMEQKTGSEGVHGGPQPTAGTLGTEAAGGVFDGTPAAG